MVEFALVLPILMALILGLVTGGAAYNRKLSMTNAVREGARFGATLDGTNGTTWTTAVQQRTKEMASTDLALDNVCVELVEDGAIVSGYSRYGAQCSAADAPPITAPGQCVVKVWAQRQSKLQAMFFTTNISLKSSSAARYDGKVGSTCT